jgi:hypothetical protein
MRVAAVIACMIMAMLAVGAAHSSSTHSGALPPVAMAAR